MKVARMFVLGLLLVTNTTQSEAAVWEISIPIVSLQPLIDREDCELIPELVGDWTTDDSLLEGNWRLRQLEHHDYQLVEKAAISNNSARKSIHLCLAHFRGLLFFDATYQTIESDGKSACENKCICVEAHLIGRLQINNSSLRFSLIDSDLLHHGQDCKRLRVACAQDDNGDHILVGPSKELQKFLVNLAKTPAAFSMSVEFKAAHEERG
jgi:hypothetical protein